MKIKDVINKPFFTLDGKKYTDDLISQMSVDELKDLGVKLDEHIKLTAKWLDARRKDRFSKEYKNRQYLFHTFQKLFEMVNDIIFRERSTAYKCERTINDYFVDEARNFLDKKVFDTIMKNAEKEMQILLGIIKV